MKTKAKQYLFAELLFVVTVIVALFLVGCDVSGITEPVDEPEGEMHDEEMMDESTEEDMEEEDSIEDELDSEEDDSEEEAESESEEVSDDTGQTTEPEGDTEAIVSAPTIFERLDADETAAETEEVSAEATEVAAEGDKEDEGEEEAKLYSVGVSQPYTPEAFAQAKKDGQTIVADVYATWCGVCAANTPRLHEALGKANDAGEDVVMFSVNFDKDGDFLKTHKVKLQSTYLLFEGGEETKRVSGSMTATAFESFIGKNS